MPVKDAKKAPVTLAHVLSGLERNRAISDVRRRDLRSAVNRVAQLHGDELARIRLDMAVISQRLASAMPAAAGLSQKNSCKRPVKLFGGGKDERDQASSFVREDPDNPELAQTDDGPFVEANAHRPVALGSLVQRQRN